MEKIIAKYNKWINNSSITAELRSQLEAMRDDHHKMEEIFYKDLEFGTSGLRGIMGPGTNRMNSFVVAKVTQGLSNYINKTLKKSEINKENYEVIISYDSRINSREFAEITAQNLSANGIKAYIFEEIMPVSLLSFAIRHLKCDYGIMITASHNSKEYNGYKVYNSNGGQILGDEPKKILCEIEKIDIFDDVKKGTEDNIFWLNDEIKNVFVDKVAKDSVRFEEDTLDDLKRGLSDLEVIYSPLNGAGRVPVVELLKKIGVGKLDVVPEQEMPDGNFKTCPRPNPEREEVYDLGLELLKKKKADILIVTDPDCDRVGVATKEGILSGNQLGVLLFEYICRKKKTFPLGSVALRSIVSTPLLDLIAKDFGVNVENTLIGFKYIGERLEELKERYVFGFEEGNGYLAVNYIGDKDGVSTSMLICEMAAEYKAIGWTLQRAMKEIYKKHGHYSEKVITYSFEGKEGQKRRENVMNYLRDDIENCIKGYNIKSIIDYKLQKKYFVDLGICSYAKLPVADIMEYIIDEGHKFIIRPSGTEPSLKAYLFVKSKYSSGISKKMEKMEKEITRIINEEQN